MFSALGLGLAGFTVGSGLMAATACGRGEQDSGPARARIEIIPGVVDVSDMRIATREARGGDELVLIHPSLARGALDYDIVLPTLARAGYRVVSFDPRGIGATRNSDERLRDITLHDLADDVRALVAALGATSAHLIGHDYGNRVMRTVAVDHPQLVRSLTLWAAGAGTPEPEALQILNTVIDDNAPVDRFQAAVKKGFFAPGNDPRVWYTGWYTRGGVSEWAASTTTPVADYQLGGTARILIVQGLQDFIAPPQKSRDLQARMGARASRVEIDHAGHCMVAEQPTQLSKVTIEFLHSIR
ncbi:alpha/beta fold hydrolase [Mycobacterium basiliense]|uniref:alpha/beta fold hydrolase n=1 Tax=Mycobacterium basiliense TaxID=2094119 RepID=UPI001E41D389|nr:alpha/beta hydrolase [Mycobacterium basiliense]